MARLRNKPLFARSASPGLRAVAFAALSVTLMVVDRRFHFLDDVRGALTVLAYPAQYLAQLPASLAGAASDALTERRALRDEIEALRQQRLLLEVQLQRLTALEAENRRLRLLLKSSETIPERVLIAELLNVDLSPYRERILLNKGSRAGVRPGLPLLAEGGVVGQTVDVSPLTASAVLITDASHALPVQIDRTGQRTLAQGGGDNHTLLLLHLPNDSDVRRGDTVSTSGLGGRFPRGYPVGRVVQVSFDPGLPFARIVATAGAQLERIREVLIVVREPTRLPDFAAARKAGGDRRDARGAGGGRPDARQGSGGAR